MRSVILFVIGAFVIAILLSITVFYSHFVKSTLPAQVCAQYIEDAKKFPCYQEYFASLVKTQSASQAMQLLAELQNSDQFAVKTCHEITHIIGNKAFEVYGSVNEASKYGNTMCYDGYHHGLMESYMSGFDDTKLMEQVSTICIMDSGGRYTQTYYDCVHGLGHGITVRFGNDVFKALPYCDVLKTEFDRNACYNGAFMQNIVVDGISHKSVALKQEDPVYPCNAVPERQKDPCYLIQSSYFLQVVDNDVAKAFVLCDTVEEKYIKTCYQSMGRDISGIAYAVPEKIVELCSLGSPDHQGECYAGAALDAVYRHRRATDADPLCNVTPEKYLKFCEMGKSAAAKLQ